MAATRSSEGRARKGVPVQIRPWALADGAVKGYFFWSRGPAVKGWTNAVRLGRFARTELFAIISPLNVAFGHWQAQQAVTLPPSGIGGSTPSRYTVCPSGVMVATLVREASALSGVPVRLRPWALLGVASQWDGSLAVNQVHNARPSDSARLHYDNLSTQQNGPQVCGRWPLGLLLQRQRTCHGLLPGNQTSKKNHQETSQKEMPCLRQICNRRRNQVVN